MQTEVISGPQHVARMAALKGFGAGVLVVGLIAVMGAAVLRETVRPKPQQVEASAGSVHADRPPVTAEEESYARALWPIHAQVKQDAVAMTFAGIAYKMGDIKRDAVRQRVAPLTQKFDSAIAALARIQPPASLKDFHGEYEQAIRLYRDASVTMVKVAGDGKDAHLVEAQTMSEKASGLTLKVGETLWPGEFKPN